MGSTISAVFCSENVPVDIQKIKIIQRSTGLQYLRYRIKLIFFGHPPRCQLPVVFPIILPGEPNNCYRKKNCDAIRFFLKVYFIPYYRPKGYFGSRENFFHLLPLIEQEVGFSKLLKVRQAHGINTPSKARCQGLSCSLLTPRRCFFRRGKVIPIRNLPTNSRRFRKKHDLMNR